MDLPPENQIHMFPGAVVDEDEATVGDLLHPSQLLLHQPGLNPNHVHHLAVDVQALDLDPHHLEGKDLVLQVAAVLHIGEEAVVVEGEVRIREHVEDRPVLHPLVLRGHPNEEDPLHPLL